jgi:pantothenate kinase type III
VLLAIDVGNTRTHFGVFSGDRLVLDWHATTNDRATADDLAADSWGPALVVETRGTASVVAKHISQIDILEPALTLIGIRLATNRRPRTSLDLFDDVHESSRRPLEHHQSIPGS